MDHPRHREALEADLLRAGLRLRDCPSERFNWRDLWVFVKTVDPNSSLFGQMHPHYAGWDRPTVMAGLQVDYLALLVWARTKDGQKNRNRPDSVLPWNRPEPREGAKTKAAPLSKVKEALAQRYQRRDDTDRQNKLTNLFRGRR